MDSRPTHSADSDVDFTAYAESKVQQLEQEQTTTPQDEANLDTVPDLNETLNPGSTTLAELAVGAPISSEEEGIPDTNLPALESASKSSSRLNLNYLS